MLARVLQAAGMEAKTSMVHEESRMNCSMWSNVIFSTSPRGEQMFNRLSSSDIIRHTSEAVLAGSTPESGKQIKPLQKNSYLLSLPRYGFRKCLTLRTEFIWELKELQPPWNEKWWNWYHPKIWNGQTSNLRHFNTYDMFHAKPI